MSDTQPLTAGERVLTDLRRAEETLVDDGSELAGAIAAVLRSFLAGYEIETDSPECPCCDTGCCGGHDLETYHRVCGECVEHCSCLWPYLLLARVATA